MLTDKQQKWVEHLSETDKVKIFPYDPSCVEKFEEVESLIRRELGDGVEVRHCGATSLGISGQNEIDVYLPIAEGEFNKYLEPLSSLFGKPRSLYPLERARFVVEIGGKHIDVFLINKDDDGWRNSEKFESYLRSHPLALDKYRQLKEEGDGLSVREYYRRKIEFINEILGK
jgi:GrpB-like predicted nucleotidyltransferase (UPF0157 family)